LSSAFYRAMSFRFGVLYLVEDGQLMILRLIFDLQETELPTGSSS